MKEKINLLLQWLSRGFVQMLRLHPVEAALIVYLTIGWIVCYERDTDAPWLLLVPLFFTLALVAGRLAGRGPWRKLYWVSWTPIVPLSLWAGLETWLETEPSFITFGILAPLALLMCTRALCNDRFVGDTILWLRSGLLALFFSNVALGLFGAILFSTAYIFGFADTRAVDHIWTYAFFLAESFATPVLFLMMADRWRDAKLEGSRILEVLLNYLVAPALLIYTAILYLYMAKILFTWSLPNGGVAYLVFGFTIFAIVVKALQFLLQKRLYDWFFNWFSLIALPTQVLFWVGVLRRVDEYGLTSPRFYLLVCGALMSLCLVAFLSRRVGRYLYVCVAAFVVFAALAYVPVLRPERVAVRSQAARAERIARALDRLDAQGHVVLTPVSQADTARLVDYHRLYEALNYVEWRDSAIFARFGVSTNDYLRQFPVHMQHFVRWGYSSDRTSNPDATRYVHLDLSHDYSDDFTYAHQIDARYRQLYLKMHYRNYTFENDTLRLYLGREEPVHTIAGRELLRRQTEKSGFDPLSVADPTPEQKRLLSDYSDEQCRIFFGSIQLECSDSLATIAGVSIQAVMLR